MVIQYPAIDTEMKFMGRRVFIESTGDEDGDRRIIQRIKQKFSDYLQDRGM